MDYLLAIDLGSTSFKVIVYDLDGNSISSASRPTEKKQQDPGKHPEWIIWDPDQIWHGVADAAREAVSRLDDSSLIRGVAVTGMGMDGVPVDRNGRHLYPFISWHDPRTAPQAEWWAKNIGAERTFAVTGFPAWAMTGVMRIMWMKEHEPSIMAQADKWLLIEDFVNNKLCGAVATDFTMASCMLLFDQKKLDWSDELIKASGVDRNLLPKPRQSGTSLGKVTREASTLTGIPEGTPVVLGGQDHICGTIPTGVYKPGTMLDVMGTWENVIASLKEPVLTPEILNAGICMQVHVVKNVYAAWGGSVAGESLEWFRKQFARDSSQKDGCIPWDGLMKELEETQPGSCGAMFLPHISSAGCPVNDSRAMAGFTGLSNSATRANLLRAIMEGLNYQFLDMVNALEISLHCKFNSITATGGMARNEFWIQNKADMMGIPIEISEVVDASPLGVAVMAGLGLGLYKNMDVAYNKVKRPGRIYNPRMELTEKYREYYQIYKQLYPSLKSISHRLFEIKAGESHK
ncbi:MAG: FGGY family carbohydrate kinase [Kiritimatiellae bacterium]|nr:FGGY family carbohydrate kinase [Kiritimatiellia bacterium]